MRRNKWDALLALGMLLVLLLACSATTANISSFKIATDEEGKNEAKTFKPGDKVYAVAVISNNGGKVQTKFRILYDDVEGQKAGTLVQGAEIAQQRRRIGPASAQFFFHKLQVAPDKPHIEHGFTQFTGPKAASSS